MNVSTLSLIMFYLISLLGSWWLFPYFRFEQLKSRPPVRWARQIIYALLLAIGVTSILFSLWLFHVSTGREFELTLYGVFAISWLATGWYVFPIRRHWLRLVVSIMVMVTLTTIASLVKNQPVNNIFMAWALFWIGPLLFRRLRISLRVFLIFLGLFMLFDFYNILHTTLISVPPSEVLVSVDGLIRWGTSLMGAGDFVLSYLMIAAAYHFFGRRSSLLMTGLFTLGLIAITILSQYSPDGLMLPFTVFIIPIALIEYFVLWKTKTRVAPTQ